MKNRVSSTVTKPKTNPRPRKYASASERQAAYRARAPEVCFRAEPKTVETLDRIADTLDQSRADVLLSMTKFALANHDWARFGLTHKPLPFEYGVNPLKTKIEWKAYTIPGAEDTVYQGAYKGYLGTVRKKGGVWSLLLMKDNKARTPLGIWDSNNGQASGAKAWLEIVVDDESWKHLKRNPAMKAKRKPTPAQLAARERFAEMARSGAFKKGAKRKKNPDGMGSYGPFYGDTDAPMTEAQIERKAESYMDRLDRQLMRNEITQTVYDREVKALNKWAKDQYAKRRKTNPAKKTVSQKISQLTREGYPQKQAVAIALNEERAGKVRRNPAAATMVHGYAVIWRDVQKGTWHTVALTLSKADATEIAQLLADRNKEQYAVQARFAHEKDFEVY